MNFDSGIINAIISGVCAIFGAVLAFWGANRGAKSQKNLTKETIRKDMDIAKMNIEEKLIAENKINWSNESRILIAQFIKQCFTINTSIETAGRVQKYIDLITDSDIPSIEKIELMKFADKENNSIKITMNAISDSIETLTLLRLHFFDDNESEQQILTKTLIIETYLQRFEKIPNEELSELTELSRKYFRNQWKELIK